MTMCWWWARQAYRADSHPQFHSSGAAQVGWFLVPGLLLMVRGCTGVTALYETKAFVWQNDHYFYLLDVLPEMLAILIFSWPFILARYLSFHDVRDKVIVDRREGIDWLTGLLLGHPCDIELLI
jgi:hypothetical protein